MPSPALIINVQSIECHGEKNRSRRLSSRDRISRSIIPSLNVMIEDVAPVLLIPLAGETHADTTTPF